MKDRKVVVPLETFIALCADVRSAMSVASFQLKFQVEQNPTPSWSVTHVPQLCDYYSCLHALQDLLEESILNEDSIMDALQRVLTEEEQNGIIIPMDSLKVVKTLMEQAKVLKQNLSMSGLSMEIH